MDPALAKKLDGIALFLYALLVVESYRAAGVVGLVVGFAVGAVVVYGTLPTPSASEPPEPASSTSHSEPSDED